MSQRSLLFASFLLPLSAASADYSDCESALSAAEQASRSAREALLISRAQQQPPAFGDSLEALTRAARAAQRLCTGAPTENSDGLSEHLPNFKPDAQKQDKPPTRRRTPAERAHGRY